MVYGAISVDAMLISVVIPTCDRHAELAACLERLAPGAQTLAAAEYEVIVTDDGQRSAEAALARQFPWVTWVAGPRRGPAANRNCGARQARGEWLAFTDDDCEPDAGWLKAFAEKIHESAFRVLEGRTSAQGKRTRIDMECPVNETGGYLWSCNFAIAKLLFAELDGFDEGFRSAAMEDVDLRWRLADLGIRTLFVEAAVVRHKWRTRKGVIHQRAIAKSVAYFVEKHPSALASFSLKELGVGVLRTCLSQIPKAARDVGVRGLAREVGLTWYKAYVISQELSLNDRMRDNLSRGPQELMNPRDET